MFFFVYNISCFIDCFFVRYTMTKTTAIVFIFMFSVIFRLEKPVSVSILNLLLLSYGNYIVIFITVNHELSCIGKLSSVNRSILILRT